MIDKKVWLVTGAGRGMARDGFRVTIISMGHEIQVGKSGVFEVTAGNVRVFSGDIQVTTQS